MNRKFARLSLTVFLVLGIGLTMALATGIRTVSADENGCPNPDNRPTSNIVGAYFTTSGNNATYYFNSFVDRSPVAGIPGLIEYCVYPDPATQPDNVVTVAVGDDSTAWVDPPGFNNFSFNRTNGNPSNIGLDGRMDYEMGTATWSGGVPANQLIVLHINDEAECNRLGQNSQTCFVLPGEQQQAQDLTVSKTADASFTRTFNWTIEKSADTDTVYSAGGGESGEVNFTVEVTKDAGTDSDFAVSGTITVNNPNSFDVNGVAISDSLPGGTCSVDDTSLDVAANSSASTDYTCTFDSNPGSGTNTATATWGDIGSPNTSSEGTDDFEFGDPTTLVNDEIDVTDTNGGSWHFTDSGSVSYDQTYTDPAGTCTPHENTATITQTGANDSVTVQDCQGADLVVTKTATPSYDLKYAWTINKTVVGDSSKMVDAGQPATFSYNITVSHDTGTQSNWKVSGKITVSNPNDWEDIVADVSDSLPGGTCSVTGGNDVNVPASGSVELDYSCTFGSNPGSGTNTATAAWDAAAAHTPNGSASGDAGFNFANATVNAIDECVTVKDDKGTPANTSDDVTLGTVCVVGDPNPKVFSYSLTFTGPAAGTCANFTNTAKFTTNDTSATGSASATVSVCSFKAALTPGYWKTHLARTRSTGCTGLPSGTGCSDNGPFTVTYLPKTLGGYNVDTILKAAQVFAAMNCSNTGSNAQQNQNAMGCLAGHLLAAKLNVANGANSCINATITAANTLLSSIPYTGPSGSYTGISLATRNAAISLKNALDAYNNGVGCH